MSIIRVGLHVFVLLILFTRFIMENEIFFSGNETRPNHKYSQGNHKPIIWCLGSYFLNKVLKLNELDHLTNPYNYIRNLKLTFSFFPDHLPFTDKAACIS